ncbi:hypothetical protein BN7_637 [Wickerhamomyces ciferrii]|uniref:Mediator of RNA polymerase II transcription subunit 9 n=1 Tax=Wickerhamomyces ciferrii (strain ATCC 14091 / BCRC 22168 / CBS 111 / JCM 3599 / NBRC 0793 / NRRL Y-1031 F-60-10) TaxID=1206466 RepID=K0K8D3_WICCF|nr:uncharacterized protein BN7_637 [Wickerhamomyces ciferrii]CCH41100.1 hypothetical protein BN7_637 [Wickerhamomyces ciferrii]
MNIQRHSSPFRPDIRLKSEQPTVSEETKLKNAEEAIQELKSLELLPLVLDIVEDVNSGKLLPKDVENAAREILRNIHGLSETPEERSVRVEKLKKNITRKSEALQRFREKVGERIALPEPPVPESLEDFKDLSVEPVEVTPNAPVIEGTQNHQLQEVQTASNDQDLDIQDQPPIQQDGFNIGNSEIQSQPLQQSDTLMTDDVNFDFNDFPTVGSQDQDNDLNMD